MSFKSDATLKSNRWNVAQFFERRWWRSYLRKKPVNGYLEWKRSYWEQFLERLDIDIQPDATVLDAGSGPAGIQMILAKQQVTAIDPLLNTYKSFDHFKEADYPWTNFISSALENFDEAERFDWVFCLNVINHVDNLDRSLDHLVAALKPGGTLVMSVDCHRHVGLQKIFQALPMDILHPHQYNLSQYKEMLQSRGIKITRTKSVRNDRIFEYNVIVGEKS